MNCPLWFHVDSLGGLRGRDPGCTVSFVQHPAERDATKAKEGHVFMFPAAVWGGWQMRVPYGEQDDTVPLVCDCVWMNQIRGLPCCWGHQHARSRVWYETWQNHQHKDNKETESFLRMRCSWDKHYTTTGRRRQPFHTLPQKLRGKLGISSIRYKGLEIHIQKNYKKLLRPL